MSGRSGMPAALGFAQTPLNIVVAILVWLRLMELPGLSWFTVILPMLIYMISITLLVLIHLLLDKRRS